MGKGMSRQLNLLRVARRLFEDERVARVASGDRALDKRTAEYFEALVDELFALVEAAEHLMNEDGFRRIHDALVREFIPEELFDEQG